MTVIATTHAIHGIAILPPSVGGFKTMCVKAAKNLTSENGIVWMPEKKTTNSKSAWK